MPSSTNQIENAGGKVLAPEDVRVFLCKLANLDLAFLASRIERAELEPIYSDAGTATLPGRVWLRVGYQASDTAVLESIARSIPQKEQAHVQRFLDSYKSLIPPDPRRGSVPRDPLFWVFELQGKLCQVWTRAGQRAKHYGVFWLIQQLTPPHLREFYAEKDVFVIPEETPFERALFQLVRDWDLAKVCGNPDCQAPYFFAFRASQKYCSVECGKPALRQAKLRWWKRERQGDKKK